MQRLKETIDHLYAGRSRRAAIFRYCLLGFDLSRIAARREAGRRPGLDLRPLAELGERRFRTRRSIRRRAPSPAEVARSSQVFDEALIAAVDSDLRSQIHAGDLLRGDERKALLADAHLATRGAVAGWRSDLLALPSVSTALDPHLVSLILASCCLEDPGPALGEVVGLLGGPTDLVGEVAFAAGMLADRLQPVYALAEDRVNTRLSRASDTRRAIAVDTTTASDGARPDTRAATLAARP